MRAAENQRRQLAQNVHALADGPVRAPFVAAQDRNEAELLARMGQRAR